MAALIRTRVRARDERGAELIEFAFVLPLLLFVCIGIIDFGFLFRDYEVLTNAAREGARLRILADNYTDQDAIDRVSSYADGAGLTGTSVSTTVLAVDIPVGASTADGFTVTATYPHRFMFLGPIATFFGGSFGTVNLTATSTMRQEVQATGP
jgi:Flp pilus assembly protein TadG